VFVVLQTSDAALWNPFVLVMVLLFANYSSTDFVGFDGTCVCGSFANCTSCCFVGSHVVTAGVCCFANSTSRF
jgi:hypothetical protein